MDGPLASFSGAETWVDHPYRDGIVLIGVAASTSDPSYGCGLSLTLRDVRVLSDLLLAEDDREVAAKKYAAEHNQYYGTIRRLTGWVRMLMHDPSPDAARLRKKALPRFAADPSRAIDLFGIGPEFPSDETARQRYFGEN